MGIVLSNEFDNYNHFGNVQLPDVLINKILEYGVSNSENYFTKKKQFGYDVLIRRPFFNARLINKFWYIYESLSKCQICQNGRYRPIFKDTHTLEFKCNNCCHLYRKNFYLKLSYLKEPKLYFKTVLHFNFCNYKAKIRRLKENWATKQDYYEKKKKFKKKIEKYKQLDFIIF
tara:strand:+ start:213 stop:731 length:519 start_codon:yes stop_codon:yes gene_type:complete